MVSAFSLFTSKGINDTSISDIVKHANMAKGTFYLYFKDKFDIRDKLIATKATQLFRKAAEGIYYEKEIYTLEDKVVYIADSVINQLDEDKMLLKFISKNLSWEFSGMSLFPAQRRQEATASMTVTMPC